MKKSSSKFESSTQLSPSKMLEYLIKNGHVLSHLQAGNTSSFGTYPSVPSITVYHTGGLDKMRAQNAQLEQRS